MVFLCPLSEATKLPQLVYIVTKFGSLIKLKITGENKDMKNMKDEQLFSERQAAEFFGWSVFTMREIRKRGEIKYLVFNNKTIRYTMEQLQTYKDAHLVGGEK